MDKKGSVCWEASRKAWRVQFSNGGTRIVKRFKDEKEAHLYLENLNLQVMVRGSINLKNYTVEEWVAEYLDKYKAKDVRPRVLSTYKSTAKLLYPIGSIDLYKLTPKMVTELIDGVDKSFSTKKKIHNLLTSALSKAKILGIVDSNIMEFVERVKNTNPAEVEIYSQSELESIRATIKDYRYSTMVLLAIRTGMRLGEVLGLKIRSVHSGYVMVENSLQADGGKLYDERPKTATSYRSIPIGKELSEALQRLIGNRKDGYVFITENNTPLAPTNIERMWKRVQEDAGVPRKRFHSLRHTFASQLIASNCSISTVSRIMGHSSVSTTLRIYTHFVKDFDLTVLEHIEKLG